LRRSAAIVKRTLLSFYDDQMTQHAAALTYYVLMSLFPAVLLAAGCAAAVPGLSGLADSMADFVAVAKASALLTYSGLA